MNTSLPTRTSVPLQMGSSAAMPPNCVHLQLSMEQYRDLLRSILPAATTSGHDYEEWGDQLEED